jgi:hypothetical protein
VPVQDSLMIPARWAVAYASGSVGRRLRFRLGSSLVTFLPAWKQGIQQPLAAPLPAPPVFRFKSSKSDKFPRPAAVFEQLA